MSTKKHRNGSKKVSELFRLVNRGHLEVETVSLNSGTFKAWAEQNGAIHSGFPHATYLKEMLANRPECVFYIDFSSSVQDGEIFMGTSNDGGHRRYRCEGFDICPSPQSDVLLDFFELERFDVINLQARAKIVELRDCNIGHLMVYSPNLDLRIIDCYIGVLDVRCDIKELSINDSHVDEFLFLDEGEQPTKIAMASLSNSSIVDFKAESPPVKYLSHLRRFLAKLENSHHSDVAHYVRGRLLRAEHVETHGIMRLVSWFYGAFADYGLNPGRALCWVPVFFLAVVLIGTCTDGVTINEAVRAELESGSSSWQDYLEYSWFASGYLAVKTLLNPFSIFDSRSLVVPNIWTLGAMFIQAVMNVGLFTVIALSVRRRFKIGS